MQLRNWIFSFIWIKLIFNWLHVSSGYYIEHLSSKDICIAWEGVKVLIHIKL